MKSVLNRYGNAMIYFDATHNTCTYTDVPLFFMAVRTNCGFQVNYRIACSWSQSPSLRSQTDKYCHGHDLQFQIAHNLYSNCS